MIEPPRLFTEERRQYDLLDVEVLGKFTLELNLQNRGDIRRCIDNLIECAGTRQFHVEFNILHDYLMRKREALLSTRSAPCSNVPSPCNSTDSLPLRRSVEYLPALTNHFGLRNHHPRFQHQQLRASPYSHQVRFDRRQPVVSPRPVPQTPVTPGQTTSKLQQQVQTSPKNSKSPKQYTSMRSSSKQETLSRGGAYLSSFEYEGLLELEAALAELSSLSSQSSKKKDSKCRSA